MKHCQKSWMPKWKWKMKSNTGTGGMESSVVLFKPRIHLFACTHPSVSISLVCNDWLAYKHQSTALCQTRLDCGPCCLQASSPPCVSNTFGMWILVCVHASVSRTVFQTRLDHGSVSGYKHLPPPKVLSCSFRCSPNVVSVSFPAAAICPEPDVHSWF